MVANHALDNQPDPGGLSERDREIILAGGAINHWRKTSGGRAGAPVEAHVEA